MARWYSFRLFKIELALIALMFTALTGWVVASPNALVSVVNAVRDVIGPEPIAFAENILYGATDAIQQRTASTRTTGFWAPPALPTPGVMKIGSKQPVYRSAVIPILFLINVAGFSTWSDIVGNLVLDCGSGTHACRLLETKMGSWQTLRRNDFSSPQPTPAPHPIIAPGTKPPQFNAPSSFSPRDVTWLHRDFTMLGEGVWTPLPNSLAPSTAPLMYKTILHPDFTRPYAQVAIVALDATRLRLHAVAGTIEPVSAARAPRPGLVSSSDLASLVAAFNGGFKAMHGHYGMMVDGQTILPPQPNADTIAIYRDGRVRIAPWSAISNTLPQMQSFRQTPAFLAYHGQVNPALMDERLITWGASVSGKTAIWRSALGVSADGRTLFYAAGESLTA